MTISPLLEDIRACRLCEANLPLGPRPVLRAASPEARVLIVGQAPGTKVHASGIPWDDASGRRLRDWMGVTPDAFYDETQFAIMPMGFCYPGRGKGGDNPPRRRITRRVQAGLQGPPARQADTSSQNATAGRVR